MFSPSFTVGFLHILSLPDYPSRESRLRIKAVIMTLRPSNCYREYDWDRRNQFYFLDCSPWTDVFGLFGRIRGEDKCLSLSLSLSPLSLSLSLSLLSLSLSPRSTSFAFVGVHMCAQVNSDSVMFLVQKTLSKIV